MSGKTNIDYYDILGLKKECSDEDIRKTFRKLAIIWHPDKHMQDTSDEKNKAEEKFKQINKAYEILGDVEKRKRYDSFGSDEFSELRGYQFHNAEDIFNGFFSSFDSDGFPDGLNGAMSHGFTHSFSNGKKIHINLGNFGRIRSVPMKGTNNTHGMRGMRMAFTNLDDDTGDNETNVKDESMMVDLNLTLEEIYKGCIKKRKITRTDYSGQIIRKENEILSMEIKQGYKEGTKITFHNKGDIYPGREPADLIFVLKQISHNIFTRNDNDLIMTLDVTLKEAQAGFTKNINAIDGSIISIRIPKRGISDSNYIHKIIDKGMPIRKEGKIVGWGDLLIKFNIKF